MNSSTKKVLLLDIDNTLADSWPTLNQEWKSESQRLSKIYPFEAVIFHLFQNYRPDEYQWVFLTSRDYRSHLVTINWLKYYNMPAGWDNVILVQRPMEKIELINKYVKKEIVYFDDLSFNHERGEVKFYEEELELLRMNDYVEYHGYDEIMKIK